MMTSKFTVTVEPKRGKPETFTAAGLTFAIQRLLVELPEPVKRRGQSWPVNGIYYDLKKIKKVEITF